VLPQTSIVLKPMTSVSIGALASADAGGVVLDLSSVHCRTGLCYDESIHSSEYR
jgi:hypothetical protein